MPQTINFTTKPSMGTPKMPVLTQVWLNVSWKMHYQHRTHFYTRKATQIYGTILNSHLQTRLIFISLERTKYGITYIENILTYQLRVFHPWYYRYFVAGAIPFIVGCVQHPWPLPTTCS